MSRGKLLRLLFVILLLGPMIALQGSPRLSPSWISAHLGGVPVIFLLVALWFALIVAATWLPIGDEDGA